MSSLNSPCCDFCLPHVTENKCFLLLIENTQKQESVSHKPSLLQLLYSHFYEHLNYIYSIVTDVLKIAMQNFPEVQTNALLFAQC